MAEVELPNPEEIRERRHDQFTKRVALVVACYAVALAIASLGGNSTGKEMLMTQQQETDQWGFYQAKAGREHQYKLQKLRLELDLADRGAAMTPEVKKKADELLKKFGDEEHRYEHEKREIEEKARELQKELTLFKRKNPYFEYAEVLLQISIVLASISMLATSRLIFFLSLILAAAGVLLTVNGFGLYFHVPLLDADKAHAVVLVWGHSGLA